MINKNRLLIFAVMIAILLVVFLGMQGLDGHADVRQAMKQADNYQIRNELLMDTISEMGVKNDEDAAGLWARGVQLRNGAMQAAAMHSALRETYLISLDRHYPNWVTAFSSPWVAEYHIEKLSSEARQFRVRFDMASSAGDDQAYEARLTVTDENGFPRILAIEMDEALKAYTGF